MTSALTNDLPTYPDSSQSSHFKVRRAVLSDVPALIVLKLQMAIDDGTEALVDTSVETWVRNGFGATPKFGAFVAEQAGDVVGMVIFSELQIAGCASPSVYVQDIFVRPVCRQRGIGQALLAQVVTHAQERMAFMIYLNVRDDNPACRLYESMGFAAAQQCKVYALAGPAAQAVAQAWGAQSGRPERALC
jgi:ribosomal protein S18 acetylase RimI-like enzyme